MVRVAIIDDDLFFLNRLTECLAQYSKEKDCLINISSFSEALSFINSYTPKYDVIFMDIAMPLINGIEAAKRLRKLDKDVCLVFITSMVQYAIKGYEVDAVGYMVKPIEYFGFSLLMDKVVTRIATRTSDELLIKTENSFTRIFLNDLQYVEVLDHYLIYHTVHGEYREFGELSKLEETLAGKNFFRCNNCYLVNLMHVMKMEENFITVGKDKVQISRRRRKNFLMAMNNYFGYTGR